ncbi:MAG: cysteine-rich CWC family protein [Xanthobacteraceae bacterium]
MRDITDPTASPSPGGMARRPACPRCGAVFGCDLSENCWCNGEAAQLPVPAKVEDGGQQDCLCPACLRAAAIPRPRPPIGG